MLLGSRIVILEKKIICPNLKWQSEFYYSNYNSNNNYDNNYGYDNVDELETLKVKCKEIVVKPTSDQDYKDLNVATRQALSIIAKENVYCSSTWRQ